VFFQTSTNGYNTLAEVEHFLDALEDIIQHKLL
jgi:hypothetical protein